MTDIERLQQNLYNVRWGLYINKDREALVKRALAHIKRMRAFLSS